jgi:hypothetical protein
LGENTGNLSATSCHEQSQPLYGMPIDTYPEQTQPRTHMTNKLADLHISGPSTHERGPSGLATVGPIFTELPRHAPEQPHTAQTLNYPGGPSAYSDGRSTYNNGRSTYNNGRSRHMAG